MRTLLRQRNFALLWWGGLISMLGDWMLMIGLPIYVFQLSNSTLATGLVLITQVLPRIALGSLAGVLVDRWDRRRTMVVANLLLATGLLPLLLVQSPDQLWIVYLVTFVQSTIRQFFGPAEGALLPTLVGEEQLLQANALNAMNNNLARLLGPPLGGFAAALVGLSAVALVDAFTFVVSATLIGLIHLTPNKSVEFGKQQSLAPSRWITMWQTLWQEWRTGLRLILAEPLLTRLFLWSAITAIGEGVMGVLMVPFVNRVLGAGAVELGWMMAAQAVGGILGGFLVPSLKRKFSLSLLLGASSVLFGFCDLMLFNYPALLPAIWPAILFFVLAGFPGVWMISALQTLMQSTTHDHYRGRVLGAYATTLAIFSLVGMVSAGYLGDLVGIVTMLNVQGAGYPIAGMLFLWLMRRVVQKGALAGVQVNPQRSQPATSLIE